LFGARAAAGDGCAVQRDALWSKDTSSKDTSSKDTLNGCAVQRDALFKELDDVYLFIYLSVCLLVFLFVCLFVYLLIAYNK